MRNVYNLYPLTWGLIRRLLTLQDYPHYLHNRGKDPMTSPMTHSWDESYSHGGIAILFMSLQNKTARREKRGNKKQGGWIFHRFYYFSGKAQVRQAPPPPRIENRKAVWQADKTWGNNMHHLRCIKQHSRHITIYMKTTGIQESAGAVWQCNNVKEVVGQQQNRTW